MEHEVLELCRQHKLTKVQKDATKWQNIKQEIAESPQKADRIRQALLESWQRYIEGVANIPRGAYTLAQALASCSWIGAPVSVLAARDPRLIGLHGVAVWDTADYVHVLENSKPRVVSVPRAATVLGVDLPEDLAAKYGHPRVEHVGASCAWLSG
jgi:RNase P/RNase MRP subunit p29